MNARSIRNRLLRVEQRIRPQDDSSFTFEELCRCMWREDQREFIKIAKDTSLGLFLRQFEFEEVERRGGRPTHAPPGIVSVNGH
jgi:hypothetical protein